MSLPITPENQPFSWDAIIQNMTIQGAMDDQFSDCNIKNQNELLERIQQLISENRAQREQIEESNRRIAELEREKTETEMAQHQEVTRLAVDLMNLDLS